MKTETHRTACDNRDRNGRAAATSQGPPRMYGQHQKLVRGKEGFYSESQREHGPADTLISDF